MSFQQIIRRTGLNRAQAEGFIAFAAKDHSDDFRSAQPLPQLFQKLRAVHVGQTVIENDAVARLLRSGDHQTILAFHCLGEMPFPIAVFG